MDTSLFKSHRTCIVVGAGLSGLIQAAELVRKKVVTPNEIQILDLGDGYGGVWRAATYPGAACDVMSHLYEISWFRNPEWSGLFPTRQEILDYYDKFAESFNLPQITTFRQEIVTAVWCRDEMVWKLTTKDTANGCLSYWTTNILILATGIYNKPSVPDIPGREEFRGRLFHASRWPDDADLTGKDIIYVGSGPTGAQVLPEIQPKVKHLTVLLRSNAFCLPQPKVKYSGLLKRIFRRVPIFLGLYSTLLTLVFLVFTHVYRPGTILARTMERLALNYLEKEVRDPVLRKTLWPTGRIGAKRPLLSSDYFTVLQKDNVRVTSNRPVRFTGNGIILDSSSTASKTKFPVAKTEQFIKADVVIFGTGFQMQRWGRTVNVVGLDGRTLGDHWSYHPSSLYGVAVDGFPNLLLVQGPNSVMPWFPLPRVSEIQATYNAKVVQKIKSNLTATSTSSFAIMPTASAVEDYTRGLQPDLATLATDPKHGRSTQYVNEAGFNTTFFPYMPWRFWWQLRRIDMKKYTVLSSSSGASNRDEV